MTATVSEKVLDLIRERGLIRPRELDEYGYPRIYLARLVDAGLLERIGRGLYRIANTEPTDQNTLVEVGKRIPGGVICLLSALQFHEFTTQLPQRIWVAIDRKAWLPQVRDLPVRFVRFSGRSFLEGIENHRVQGVEIRIFNPAKTIADCFKYRNKIGLDVALEALRDGLQQKKCTIPEIWKYAEICRVSNVIRPYLEALVSGGVLT